MPMAVEPSADMMDQAACAAIRELLHAQNVPAAGFIDDHVANGLFQRNVLRDCLVEIAPLVSDEVRAKIDAALTTAKIKQ